MSKNQTIIGIVVVLLLVVGGVYYYNNSKNEAEDSTEMTQEQTPSATDQAMEDSSSSASTDESTATGAVKELTVSGSSFKFEPSTLTVNKGDKVKLTFANSGGTHDFVIDELNVKTQTLQSGGTETVEFTADKAGTFKYYCSVGNHRQMGMEGTLTVK